MKKTELRERMKALLSNRAFVAGLCFVVLAGIGVFLLVSARINEQKQDALIRNMKDLSYFEYFYFAGSTKIREITRYRGRGYKRSPGLGSLEYGFGQADLPLWQGTREIDESLQLYPTYLLRIAEDEHAYARSQYADLTINYVENSDDPDIMDYVETAGFIYDQGPFLITSNGRIYEVADQSFFVELFSFLYDQRALPPKVM